MRSSETARPTGPNGSTPSDSSDDPHTALTTSINGAVDNSDSQHAEKENLMQWPANALPMPPPKTANTTRRRRRWSDTFGSRASIIIPPSATDPSGENRRSFELKKDAIYSMQTDGTLEQLSVLEKIRANEGFTARQSFWRRLAIQSSPEDTSQKELIHRSTLIIISTFTVVAGIIWAGMYFALGEYLAALCPAIYSCLMGLTLAICICNNNQFSKRGTGYGIFAKCQLTLILVLPFAVHVALGGVQESGCVMLWSFLCPMGSAFFRSAKEAVRWFYVYLSISLALLAMGFREESQKHVEYDPIRESKVESLYFTMNILGVMSVVFIAVFLFARDLEHEYAQSEEVLTNMMPSSIVTRIKRGEFPIGGIRSLSCITFTFLCHSIIFFPRSRSPVRSVRIICRLGRVHEGLGRVPSQLFDRVIPSRCLPRIRPVR